VFDWWFSRKRILISYLCFWIWAYHAIVSVIFGVSDKNKKLIKCFHQSNFPSLDPSLFVSSSS